MKSFTFLVENYKIRLPPFFLFRFTEDLPNDVGVGDTDDFNHDDTKATHESMSEAIHDANTEHDVCAIEVNTADAEDKVESTVEPHKRSKTVKQTNEQNPDADLKVYGKQELQGQIKVGRTNSNVKQKDMLPASDGQDKQVSGDGAIAMKESNAEGHKTVRIGKEADDKQTTDEDDGLNEGSSLADDEKEKDGKQEQIEVGRQTDDSEVSQEESRPALEQCEKVLGDDFIMEESSAGDRKTEPYKTVNVVKEADHDDEQAIGAKDVDEESSLSDVKHVEKERDDKHEHVNKETKRKTDDREDNQIYSLPDFGESEQKSGEDVTLVDMEETNVDVDKDLAHGTYSSGIDMDEFEKETMDDDLNQLDSDIPKDMIEGEHVFKDHRDVISDDKTDENTNDIDEELCSLVEGQELVNDQDNDADEINFEQDCHYERDESASCGRGEDDEGSGSLDQDCPNENVLHFRSKYVDKTEN